MRNLFLMIFKYIPYMIMSECLSRKRKSKLVTIKFND